MQLFDDENRRRILEKKKKVDFRPIRTGFEKLYYFYFLQRNNIVRDVDENYDIGFRTHFMSYVLKDLT